MKINRRKFETISQGRFFHPKSQDIFYFLDNILLFEFDLETQANILEILITQIFLI
jgi:hypothetical protein